eukprot:6631093-Prymnesium_polylepis.1
MARSSPTSTDRLIQTRSARSVGSRGPNLSLHACTYVKRAVHARGNAGAPLSLQWSGPAGRLDPSRQVWFKSFHSYAWVCRDRIHAPPTANTNSGQQMQVP